MTDTPVFSVLCSAYRCEDYLAATLDSVLAQSYPDWELIVVDNGMSDAVAAVVHRYRDDPRVRLIRQPNRGLIGGIAAAAGAARGRYLVPLDSDDQLMPEFCARMAEVLDGRPGIDALSCDAFIFTDEIEGNLVRSFLRHRTGPEHSLTVSDLVGRHDVVPYFATFRRTAWDAAGGYAEGTELVEDIALLLRLVETGHDVRVLPERLARYRMRDDSASRNPSSAEVFEHRREQVYTAAADASGDPTLRSALQRRLRGLRYERALRRARWAFLHDDLAAARTAAGDAFRLRHTARSAAVLVGIHVLPSGLRRIHATKRQLTVQVSRLGAALRAGYERGFRR